MMEPQLRRRDIRIVTSLPREPLMVLADRVRLEQVLINLLRNALDATKDVPAPEIRIVATGGENGDGGGARQRPRDRRSRAPVRAVLHHEGPGDGVGLGLAISSSIVNDFGGRLTARNGREGGAVFEMILPALDPRAGRQRSDAHGNRR
jgi:two-component system, NtrC family, C4-dicarboxylate transport sensor histidine kinase DctB